MLLHRLIEAQAAIAPDAEAVRAAGEGLVYRDLDAAANAVARDLRELGVGPEAIVVVGAERSLEVVVALLGVLKAGAAFLPVGTRQPPARLAKIFDGARPAAYIADGTAAEAAAQGIPVLRVDRAGGSVEAPAVLGDGGTAAYVIYTSGTTGTPKGVVVEHRAIGNHVEWLCRALPLGAGDRVLQLAPLDTDAALTEVFWPLAAGAGVVLPPPDAERDPGALAEILAAERVTAFRLPPSLLPFFLDAVPQHDLRSLRYLVVGGEPLPSDLRDRALRTLPGVELHNRYGPTEATVAVTYGRCDPGMRAVPLGDPIPGVTLHVLGEDMAPVDDGEPGELFVAGVALARGYLADAALTAERFVPDPHGPAGARMLRTGDVVRRLPDGGLTFLSRKDDLVKIRGMRVEPGEIEHALASHSAVERTVVVPRGTEWRRSLVAFVVPARGAELSPDELRRHVREQVPEHMVPDAITVVDAIPLTGAGKADRAQLARRAERLAPPPAEAPAEDRPAPADAVPGGIGADILAICGEALELDDVDPGQSFFDQGGHSLLAISVVSEIRGRLGLTVPIPALFEAQTLDDFVEAVVAESRRAA